MVRHKLLLLMWKLSRDICHNLLNPHHVFAFLSGLITTLLLGHLVADIYGDAVAQLHVHLLVLPVLDGLGVGDGR